MNTAGLRQVGEFMPMNRPLVRTIRNPLDRATIVSVLPKRIHEVKHTIEPGVFDIEPGSPDKPTVLSVGGSSWWRDIDVEQPILEIPTSAVQVADSIVKDYCNGLLGSNMSDAMPGLFFILGEMSADRILSEYQTAVEAAIKKQNNWFRVLIKLADSLWARSNGNPLVIADEMRLGARMLGYDDKPWLRDFQPVAKIACFACGALRDPNFPVCMSCRAIDPKHPASKDLNFAK